MFQSRKTMLDRTALVDEIKAELLAQNEDLIAQNEGEVSGFKLGEPTKCPLCRARFVYCGPDDDNSGRFCSDRCRDAYDTIGLRYRPPDVRYTHGDGRAMTPVTGGFRIACRSCHVGFNSNGLAFCSDECRRLDETRKETTAAGHSPRQCRKCIDCGGRIARYTPSGRATKATVVRCSPCQRKATRVAKAA
jgi:hypothetical protein